MENQLQTPIPQNDVMTIGDFLASGKPVENTPKDVITLDEFEGRPTLPNLTITPVPEEHKAGFIKSVAMNLYQGALAGATSFNQLIGLGAFKKTKDIFIEPGAKEAAKLREETYSQNKAVQFGNDFIASLGNMGVTLPIDIMTGGATKTRLAGKVLPEVETILNRMPDFALGSGWRGLLEGVESPGNVIEKTAKGVVGAGESMSINTAFGTAGSEWKAVPKITALGWGSSVYEAAKEGRLPTQDEQISGAANGAAYGVAFAILPHLKDATKIKKEKIALDIYEKTLQTHAENGDFEKVKATVDTLMADEQIRPEVKEAIKTVITPEPVREVPGDGETKVRGLAEGVESKAIENKLTQSFGDLPEYKTINLKDQALKAQDLLAKDQERARRIAMGEELAPEGLLPESIFVAVENQAVKAGDVSTLRALAVSSQLTTEATTMGQRIRMLGERDPESPVTAINEVVKARQESAQKRLKTKETTKLTEKDVSDIRNEIKKTAATKETWADFIRSIQC